LSSFVVLLLSNEMIRRQAKSLIVPLFTRPALVGLIVFATLLAPCTAVQLYWLDAACGETNEGRAVECAEHMFVSVSSAPRSVRHRHHLPNTAQHAREPIEILNSDRRMLARRQMSTAFSDWFSPLRC
jgi:hypothetical protein